MSKLKKDNEDYYLYILLLTTVIIFLEALKPYTFNIININLTYSLFGLPLLYYITNYIAKTYNYKKAVIASLVSTIALICFNYLTAFALGETLIFSDISGEILAYIRSQIVNLIIYAYIHNNIHQKSIFTLLNYLLSLVTYYMVYTIIYLDKISLDTYWKGYFITLGIQIILCTPLIILENIKKTN